jgi:hypothetical protein
MRGLVESETVRNFEDVLRGNHSLVGKSTGRQACANPIAYLQIHSDVSCHFGNNSGNFSARYERRRRTVLMFALNHKDIGKAHPSGTDFNANRARNQWRRGNVLNVQRVYAAEIMTDYSAHELPIRLGSMPAFSASEPSSATLGFNATRFGGKTHLLCDSIMFWQIPLADRRHPV